MIELNLDNTLKKFLEIEYLPGDNKERINGEEEIFCEGHFKNTCKRDSIGRFIVQLPMRKSVELVLGEFRENDIKRIAFGLG